jgi:predicted DNA-binding transcriptional regulator AlpA
VTDPIELIEWDAFASRLPTLTARIALRMARRGEFPVPVRFSPRTPPLWRSAEVESWIKARLGAAEEATS